MPLFFLQIARAADTTANGSGGSLTPIDPGIFVHNFYQFALIIGGILAFGAIVFGGLKYSLSAGNPSNKSDGKEWVIQAILGLILLFGVYIILNTINPNLTNLKLPTLKEATSNTTSGGGGW